MATSVRWFDSERTVFLLTFEGKWTWEELYETVSEIHKMGDSVPHETWGIVSLVDGAVLPQYALSNFRRMTTNSPHERTQGFAIVLSSSFLQAIAKALQHMMPPVKQKYLFTRSFDEAVKWIEDQKQLQASAQAGQR